MHRGSLEIPDRPFACSAGFCSGKATAKEIGTAIKYCNLKSHPLEELCSISIASLRGIEGWSVGFFPLVGQPTAHACTIRSRSRLKTSRRSSAGTQ
eukprot:scaffold334_cov241-Pinguiococcus_pyrenoidosus.AAC.8